MNVSDLDESARSFLMRLNDVTGGDASKTVSMYDIGDKEGLDRETAAKIAEILIGNQLASIKTLAGGIGITETALNELAEMEHGTSATEHRHSLSGSLMIDDADREALESILNALKCRINDLELEFDALAGLMADIRTVDMQLTSPSPRTAVIRECFISIHGRLAESKQSGLREPITDLLGGEP
ncbi:MAG: hypothetical protein R6U50_14270 [Desulfobacterales bacterium]